jgi:hypothetical protein
VNKSGGVTGLFIVVPNDVTSKTKRFGVSVSNIDHPFAATSIQPSFVLWIALAIALVVVIAFAPIYWLRFSQHDPNLTWLVNLHGLAMLAWIALLITQVSLVRGRNISLHRRLGSAGAALAVMMVILGLIVVVHGAERHAHGDPRLFRLMLVAFDGLSLLVFLMLVSAAILLRKRSDYHRRLILLATLGLLGPAFGRLTSIVNGFGDDSDTAVLVLMTLPLLVFAVVDVYRLGRLHAATGWGISLVAIANVLTYLAKS